MKERIKIISKKDQHSKLNSLNQNRHYSWRVFNYGRKTREQK